ncbi:DsrE family protein [Mongoliitalea daihaiensis]|uniref:DsrE family protein n=1 Tax=Mongoliitalea daihaiensis TaxID=2782006 RepID=UPI001F33EB74|nr:DsrE family protein [Mongoliitalea daihaiensis]UJP65032.1 DsrE family protein [Mongoliitalea daihaiensis]
MKNLIVFFFLSFLLAYPVVAQRQALDPIVKGFGKVYEIPEATELPNSDQKFNIIIDLVSAAENPAQINRMVDNIARMINLHGIGGVQATQLQVKVAVHGGAIYSILNDEFYRKLYGVNNPNLPVYEALKDAGVEFYICGQSLLARDMQSSDMWDGAEMALSMLTTLTKYVPQGYMLMRF